MLFHAVLSGLLLGLICGAPLMFLSPKAFESEDELPFGKAGAPE